MKKTIIRCLSGAPIGLAVTTIIAIIISLCVGDGTYYAVVPQLVEDCGSEMKAVIFQTLCSLVYGAAFAGASVIWEKENWSLLRQTISHLSICSIATFPVAYYMQWMEHSIWGILRYYGIFFVIYLIIWLSQYIFIKKHVKQINMKVQEEASL